MRKTWASIAALAAALVATGSGPVAAREPDLDAILTRLDDLYRSKASIARAEIGVTSPRATRQLRVKTWSLGEDKALIVIEAPAREAGIATLKVGDNLWNYLPRIARTIRVPASMMLGSWMGTDFTNDDLVKESSYRRDFVSRIAGPSESPPGWRIISEVKPGVVGRWARIEMLVTRDYLPVQMRFFDRRGDLARTLSFDDVRDIGGRRVPTRLTLVPVDPPGQRTEMRYLEAQFDADVPESTFSLTELERKR